MYNAIVDILSKHTWKHLWTSQKHPLILFASPQDVYVDLKF